MEIEPFMLPIQCSSYQARRENWRYHSYPRGGNCCRRLQEKLFEVFSWFIRCTILYGAVGGNGALFTVSVSSAMQLIKFDASMHAHKPMSACIYYVSMNVYVYIYLFIFIYVYTHTFVYVSMYIYICNIYICKNGFSFTNNGYYLGIEKFKICQSYEEKIWTQEM
jgi:hypothetical protein